MDLELAVGQLVAAGGGHHLVSVRNGLLIAYGVGALAGDVIGVSVGRDGGGLGFLLRLGGLPGGQGFRRRVLLFAVHHQHRQNGCQQHHSCHSQSNGRGAGDALFLLNADRFFFGSRNFFPGRLLGRGCFFRGCFPGRKGFLRDSRFLRRPFPAAAGADRLPVLQLASAILTILHGILFLLSRSEKYDNPAKFTTFDTGMQAECLQFKIVLPTSMHFFLEKVTLSWYDIG